MQKLELTKHYDTGLSQELSNLSWLQLSNTPFAEGAFGSIYYIKKTNVGYPKTEFVTKVFKAGTGSATQGLRTVHTLQQRVIDKDRELRAAGKKGVAFIPMFDGFPLVSFEGKLNGAGVSGYVAKRLDTLGYVDFDSILENRKLGLQLGRFSLQQKFTLILQLVEGMKILKQAGFVHADINPPNLFIDLQHMKVTLIDFDSGAVMLTPNDTPTTFGKPGDWLAPEIMQQLISSRNRMVHVDIFTDAWSIAVGIHYILFGCHPLFFLTNLGSHTVSSYLSRYAWPDINETDSVFNKVNRDAYKGYRQLLTQIPVKFIEKMGATVNMGYMQPSLRTSYESWELALKSAEEPAAIDFFKVDNVATFETLPVKFSWSVKDAQRVILQSPDGNQTDVTKMNAISVLPKEGIYRLHAVGHFGSDSRQIAIRVWQHPKIQFITLPALPVFNKNYFLPSLVVQAPAIILPGMGIPSPTFPAAAMSAVYKYSPDRFRQPWVDGTKELTAKLLSFFITSTKEITNRISSLIKKTLEDTHANLKNSL